MKRSIEIVLKSIIAIVFGITASVLCVKWFSWEALLVLALWTMGNNLSQKVGDNE